MNEEQRLPGVHQRLGASLIDLIITGFIANLLFFTWGAEVMGGLPETAADLADLLDAGAQLAPLFLLTAWVGLAVLSWTPILGRRSIGMRTLGIRLVVDGK